MKSKTVFLVTWVILAGLSAPFFASADTTSSPPFDEGTGTHRLTPEEKQGLLEYAENSRVVLSDALDAAKGKGFAEANRLYLFAIKKVVIASYQSKPRAELLMRQALNQALELTFGVPAADGSVTPGVLVGSINQELLTVILGDSIQLAIQFADDDRKAINDGNLVNLPYIPFASQRLALAQKWLSSVVEWNYMYSFSVTALQQWLNTALGVDNLGRAQFAEEIVKVDQALGQLSEAGPARDTVELERRVRFLRATIHSILSSLSAKLPGLQSPPSPPPSIVTSPTDSDSLKSDVKIGDQVVISNEPSQIGTARAIFPDGKIAVEFSDGSTYNWERSRLAKTTGCSDGLCVGDPVINSNEPAGEGKVVGIFQSGKFAVQYGDDGIYHWSRSSLAKESGCIDGLCVGDQVINTNGAKGSVGGIFQGGKFAIRFVNGIYNWERSGLAKL